MIDKDQFIQCPKSTKKQSFLTNITFRICQWISTTLKHSSFAGVKFAAKLLRESLRKEQSVSKFTSGTQNFQSNQYEISEEISGKRRSRERSYRPGIKERWVYSRAKKSTYKYLYSYCQSLLAWDGLKLWGISILEITCKGIRIPESGKFLLVESGILGFGIRNTA